MSAKNRLKEYLLLRGEATNVELANLMRYRSGQLSWGQRIRELRKDFLKDEIKLKCSYLTKGIYLYKLIYPNVKQESSGQYSMV